MRTALKITTCVVAAASLSGCQGVMSALGFSGGEARADASAPIFGQEDLDMGRMALKSGNPGNAIRHFQVAALNKETAADAFNGLGVAYAKLGRADLAERYFKTAVNLDAANPKFAGNLANFYASDLGQSSRALAMRQKEADATLARAEASAESQGMLVTGNTSAVRMGSVLIETNGARLRRSSAGELKLSTGGTVDAGMAGSFAISARNPRKAEVETEAEAKDAPEATTSEDKSKSVQISQASETGSSAGYPVRVAIAKPKPAARVNKLAGTGYPVRVAIGTRSGVE